MFGFRIKTNTFVAILHALATWMIVGLSIWAIWWTDFGERAATLLKTEIIEERTKVRELRQQAEHLQQLLTDKEIALQGYERRGNTLEQRIRNYEVEVLRLEEKIEAHTQQVVDDSLRSWSAKAGGWMTGHKIRAEVGSKWDEHIAWMNKLREWKKGTPIPSRMPYIWNLGLIREEGRGNWRVRMLVTEDCDSRSTEDGKATAGELPRLSIVEEWLACGKMFEREYVKSVSMVEAGGIYTLEDLMVSVEDSLRGEERKEIERRRKETLSRVLENHNLPISMPLRMRLKEGAQAEDIIAEGQRILENYDRFETALEALRKKQ